MARGREKPAQSNSAREPIGWLKTGLDQSVNSYVIGEKGAAADPVFLICVHHDAPPACPCARDSASGIGIVLERAEFFA
jgi:hypothetical protein